MPYSEKSHYDWMKLALKEASRITIIKKNVRTEVPVCALIVKDGILLSKSTNLVEQNNDPTAHAEIIAIKQASEKLNNWRLNGCILYVTLEPCSMCMGAILNSRMSEVVFGAYDSNLGACGSVINLAHELGKTDTVEITGGILEKESQLILKDFFFQLRTKA